MWQAVTEVGLHDLIDMGVVGIGLYGLIVWLRRARAGLGVLGLLGVGAVYVLAREYRFELTAQMLKSFFAVFVIVLVVMLQADLRRLFERAARWRPFVRTNGTPDHVVRVLARALCALAARRHGALVVLAGRDPVERYIDGGTTLDGQVSVPVLLSLFDPGSPGHDGAVLLEGGRVRSFGAHLPLSHNFEEVGERGTRHSAALGLAETTDALVFVVSEERGEIAVAHDGRMRVIGTTPAAVEDLIQRRWQASAVDGVDRAFSIRRPRWADAVAAGMLTIGLWIGLVAGTQVSTKTVQAPVLVNDVRNGYELDRIEPSEVAVVLTGLRRDLYLVDPTTVTVRLDASSIGPAGGTLRLVTEDVRRPDEVSVREIAPDRIEVSIRAVPPTVPLDGTPAATP